MSVPGFGAEFGLYRSLRTYQTKGFSFDSPTNEIIVPAMCNQSAYEQCVAHNYEHMPPGSLEVYCLTQYGCILNGDICVGVGADRRCEFGGEITCGGNVCSAEQACCDLSCRDLASDPNNCGRCGNICHSGYLCCNGICKDVAIDPDNCGTCGNVIQAGNTCCNGNSIPPTSQLQGGSQYFLYAPGCSPIDGLKVVFDAAQDPMNSATGFSVQLNAFQQGTLGNWLQFLFFVDSNGAISANIQDHTTSSQYPGGSSSYANFTKTNQDLSIELTYDSNNELVNGAIFSACDSSGCESYPLSVPNPSHHTVNAFQVNVVFDPGGPLPAYATFTQGSGIITYQVAHGQQLCNLGIHPAQGKCETTTTNTYQLTGEASNIVYDSIGSSAGSCCGRVLTQNFSAPAS
jgi:hypothetical protein